MDKFMSETFGLLAMIVGVAILAIIVTRSQNVAEVFQGGANAFSNVLGTALSPVTGGVGGGFGYGGSLRGSVF